MTFEIIKHELNQLISGEKLRHEDWANSDYICINEEGNLVDQDGKIMSFDLFDDIHFVIDLVKFDPACYNLTQAIEHLVKESGLVKRATEKGEKQWYMSGEEIKCYFIFAPGQFRVPFSCFDEDDLVAKNYELIYNY